MIFSLYVINKAGGLIYHSNYNEGLNKLTSNDYLIFAGTFHGVHAISSQISPLAGSSGIQVLETAAFTLRCFQTLTGTKFLLLTDPRQRDGDTILRKLYEFYADYVMKNPFYQNEMPIRCQLFDRHLDEYCKGVV